MTERFKLQWGSEGLWGYFVHASDYDSVLSQLETCEKYQHHLVHTNIVLSEKLREANAKIERFHKALVKIALLDYRGNRETGSVLASETLRLESGGHDAEGVAQ